MPRVILLKNLLFYHYGLRYQTSSTHTYTSTHKLAHTKYRSWFAGDRASCRTRTDMGVWYDLSIEERLLKLVDEHLELRRLQADLLL